MDLMATQKKAGILIPIFSLRSKEGFGVGDFADLFLLTDFAEKTGFSLIQFLPVYDTSVTKTWRDSYCYSVLSMFALHPIYLRIEKAFSKIPEDILNEIRIHKDIFNGLEEVDYEGVYENKITICKKLYPLQEKCSDCKRFVEENNDWLPGYAVFSVLRDFFRTSDFSLWGEYRIGSKKVILEVCSKYQEEVDFYYFLQFHLHQQFKEASEYAKSKGILFKGDFPVGVHVHSVETWMTPDLFVLQRRVGAPPDYFNKKGQNWDFPAYNWPEVKKSSYHWFVRRLQHMEKYFKLVRIDHILGYFRFWEISERYSRGVLGYFNPSLSIPLENIPQDVARYCAPYINDVILDKYFGVRKSFVTEIFFDKLEKDRYCFKSIYQKQQAIDLVKDLSEEEREFIHELYENVVLLQDLDKESVFYPRMGFENTASFLLLDEKEKEHCKNLSKIYFSEEEEELWKIEGLEKLKYFQEGTSMEICAEDLGMIPNCAEEVLQNVGFLRLHIQRMPKKEGEEFSAFSDYEYLSVCSPSNHDTSTLRMWWLEDREKTQRFYRAILKGEGEAPLILTESLCEKIIQMHLESASKWAIFLMQDLLAMSPGLKRKEFEKERINDPAINPFYWRWRLHKTLEDLLAEEFFTSFLYELVLKSGRI